jgi:hypothetical protein
MKKKSPQSISNINSYIIALVCIVSIAAGFHSLQRYRSLYSDTADNGEFLSSPFQPTPWRSVGGCGTGGGVASGGSSAQWIGAGVTGGYVDCEIRSAFSATTAIGGGTSTLGSFSFPFTLNLHPRISDISLSMPLQWKLRPVREENSRHTGGFGDLNITFSKGIGTTGGLNITAGLTLPTGKYTIYDLEHDYAGSDMQNGGGVFGLSLGGSYTVDRDWGVIMAGIDYSGGMLYIESVERELKVYNEGTDDEYMRAEPVKRKLSSAKETFTTTRNDMGVLSADNLSLHGHVAFKRGNITHSFGGSGSIPLAAHKYEPNTGYDTPKIDINDPQTFYNDNYQRFTGDSSRPFSTIYLLTKEEALWFINNIKDIDYSKQGDSIGVKLVYPEKDGTTRISYDAFYKPGEDSTDLGEWIVEKRESVQHTNWISLSINYGMEIHNPTVPIFWAISVPIEFNGDDGVGVTGFTAEIGIKFVVF